MGLYPLGDYGLFLSSAQALPVSTNADSTNTIDLLANDGVYVRTALALLVDLDFTNGNTVTIKVLQSEDDSTWETNYITYIIPAGTQAERIAIGLINPKRYIKTNYVTTENLSSTITAQLVAWKM